MGCTLHGNCPAVGLPVYHPAMRMRSFLVVMFSGLMAAGQLCAQERSEPVRAIEPRVMPPRAADVQRIQRDEMRRSAPTPAYQQQQQRLGRDSAVPRSRLFDERSGTTGQTPFRQDPRDPRAGDYRLRSPASEFRGGYVPQDMQRAIERAQSEHGGKVLSADRIRYRGQDTYRVKLLTPGGRVRVVQLAEPQPQREQEDQRKGEQ